MWRLRRSETAFDSAAKFLSIVPGRIGSGLRAAFYTQTLRRCSPDVAVGFGSFFSHMPTEVGRDVRIGSYCIVGTTVIGDDVEIDDRVSVLSGRHQHGGGGRGMAGKHNEVRYETLCIGNGTRIKSGAIVMADVGARCVVESGSTVTKPLPDGSVVTGNPARPVLTRLTSG